MKFRLLFIALLFVSSLRSQFNMPSFEVVVSTFFSAYAPDQAKTYVKFQRKKDGWYVARDEYANQGNYFDAQLFWSKATNTFHKLNYPVAGDTTALRETVTQYLKQIGSDFETYQYQRNKYYGYPGWDWDLINEKEEAHLTDSLLESKARAYSNYASGFIAEQFGDVFINNDEDRVPLKASAKIPVSRINKFLKYEEEAIKAYAALRKLNPEYETKVGNIQIKLANEYMFTWLELQMSGDSNKAKKFIIRAEYPDSILAIAKAWLAGVPANAVLVTGGDNDTYPLWYLQEVQRYRADVSVLNHNLIGFRRYLHFIDKLKEPHLFTTKDSSYLRDDMEYFLFDNNTDSSITMDVNSFQTNLLAGRNPYSAAEPTPYKGGHIKTYYARELWFETPDKKRSKFIRLDEYMLLNDFILIDIMNTIGQHKIWFTFYLDWLAPVLEQKGELFEFTF